MPNGCETTRGTRLLSFAWHYLVALPAALALSASIAYGDEVYQDPQAFLREVFAGDPPAPQILWLTPEFRLEIRAILGHEPSALRIRYWQKAGRTAWVLEEIGKEQPITTGIVTQLGHVEMIKVLIYRESRGAEVRYPAFTDQFRGAALTHDGQLDHPIDGISGATLSVRSLTRLARLALYLEHHASAPPH